MIFAVVYEISTFLTEIFKKYLTNIFLKKYALEKHFKICFREKGNKLTKNVLKYRLKIPSNEYVCLNLLCVSTLHVMFTNSSFGTHATESIRILYRP